MIIVQLFGGLGNQMFQYAAGKALAIKNNTHLLLDITSFRTDKLRVFDLLYFDVESPVASDSEIGALKCVTSLQRVQAYLTPYSKKKFYKQPYYHFDGRFFMLHDPVYIKGYFQSEKYFVPAANHIRDVFTFKARMPGKVKALAGMMKEQASVSIHVRHGDYHSDEALQYHGILPLSYYQSAIALMHQRYPDAVFYIFSDDVPWVEQSLQLPGATVVSGVHTSNHFEDLYLMSQCRHNIIANSSFSWWGAWLGTAEPKTVIAPKQWFQKGSKDRQDLLPENWITL